MRKLVAIFLILISISVVAQRDSIPLGSKYSEDQFYISITYNQLSNQPKSVSSSGFSYGLGFGVFKDISLNKKGSLAIGLGLGYAFDSFNHGLQVSSINGSDVFSVSNILESNTMNFQILELPFELRWRNSNAQRYKFWRIYPGIKLGYNLKNKFSSTVNGISESYTNINSVPNFQYGLTLSTGYDAFNLHVYYSLTPVFQNAFLNSESINTRILRIGLIIYIL